MNSYQQSLKNLFKAEEEANKIIMVAEEKKENILEQAIGDANKEVENLRNQYEQEFQEEVSKNKNDFSQLDTHINKEIQTSDKDYKQNKAKVLDLLLD